jgi:hypothetical protein
MVDVVKPDVEEDVVVAVDESGVQLPSYAR